MFLFYVLSVYKKGDTIQGGDSIQGRTLFKEIRYVLVRTRPQLIELKENPLDLQISFLPQDFLFLMSRFKKSAPITFLVGEYLCT